MEQTDNWLVITSGDLMDTRQQNRSAYIQNLFEQCALSRNQIATLSGLSNPYLLDLEKGAIANVGRDKLIALAVAVDLGLPAIDALLTVFDRAPLNIDDIALFLDSAPLMNR
jgi:predicted XRE-type DNA-binding protein